MRRMFALTLAAAALAPLTACDTLQTGTESNFSFKLDTDDRELYADRYAEERFVEVVDRPPSVREVRDSNLCRIHVDRDAGGRILVFGVIDNLWKGAAGQAVQNLNLMLGLDEGEGLR